jgi:1-acyl-sn-glycerol-3-phosphate acyltransferase
MDGLEHVPPGAAIMVGNHGLLGYESIVFFEQIYARTGRVPIGCADRWFFRVPLLRDVLVRVGGMYGSAANAAHALARGQLVVCYPGGAREVLKRDARDKYRLRWDKSHGFVRVAIRTGVPIVPFAAAGVDDTFDIVASMSGTGALLMGHDKYDLPLLWGAGPLPRRVPFFFRFAEPIACDARTMEEREALASDDRFVRELHERVRSRTQALLDALVDEWTVSTGAAARGWAA